MIDLRNPGEAARETERPVVDADARAGIRFVSCPTEDPDDPHFIEICGPWLDHPLSHAVNIGLYPEKFAEVFREIAGAGGAVLVHCAAGRHRTAPHRHGDGNAAERSESHAGGDRGRLRRRHSFQFGARCRTGPRHGDAPFGRGNGGAHRQLPARPTRLARVTRCGGLPAGEWTHRRRDRLPASTSAQVNFCAVRAHRPPRGCLAPQCASCSPPARRQTARSGRRRPEERWERGCRR